MIALWRAILHSQKKGDSKETEGNIFSVYVFACFVLVLCFGNLWPNRSSQIRAARQQSPLATILAPKGKCSPAAAVRKHSGAPESPFSDSKKRGEVAHHKICQSCRNSFASARMGSLPSSGYEVCAVNVKFASSVFPPPLQSQSNGNVCCHRQHTLPLDLAFGTVGKTDEANYKYTHTAHCAAQSVRRTDFVSDRRQGSH